MRTMHRALCLATATLALATANEEVQRETLNVGVTVGDANVGASFTAGCFRMEQGKLNVMVCLDKKSSAALTAAKRKWEGVKKRGLTRTFFPIKDEGERSMNERDCTCLQCRCLVYPCGATRSPHLSPKLSHFLPPTSLPHSSTATIAYAKVEGNFQNSATKPSCQFSWEGLDAELFDALKTTPPQISVGKKDITIAATEKVPFSLLLPLEQNDGVFPITGSTGIMTTCSMVAKGMPVGTAPLAPVPVVATTPVEEVSASPPATVVDPVVEPEPAAAVIDKQEVSSPAAAIKASVLMTVGLGVVTMLLILL